MLLRLFLTLVAVHYPADVFVLIGEKNLMESIRLSPYRTHICKTDIGNVTTSLLGLVCLWLGGWGGEKYFTGRNILVCAEAATLEVHVPEFCGWMVFVALWHHTEKQAAYWLIGIILISAAAALQLLKVALEFSFFFSKISLSVHSEIDYGIAVVLLKMSP